MLVDKHTNDVLSSGIDTLLREKGSWTPSYWGGPFKASGKPPGNIIISEGGHRKVGKQWRQLNVRGARGERAKIQSDTENEKKGKSKLFKKRYEQEEGVVSEGGKTNTIPKSKAITAWKSTVQLVNRGCAKRRTSGEI